MSALRVLVVGTETQESQHVCCVLEKARHAVVPVPSVDEASEALLIQKFDVVLITPAISSDGAAQLKAQLRQAEQQQRAAGRTPVLTLLSGVDTAGGVYTSGGANAYLADGFEPAAFAKTVENLANAVTESNETGESAGLSSRLEVFNALEFKEQVAFDRELMVEIIDLFLSEREHDVLAMTESLAARDLNRLMRCAHTIKGSLGSLHAHVARHRSQELETAAKSGNWQTCVALLAALEHDLEELEPQLISLRNSVQSN